MEEIWKRIEVWLASNAPAILSNLQDGVDENVITEAEASLNVKFSEEFKVSYRIHNGQGNARYALMGMWYLLPIDQIISEWKAEKELYDAHEFDDSHSVVETKGSIQARWWDPGWIPITRDNAGDYQCFDTIPPAEGNYGQIIVFWHADETREVLAPDFASWLNTFADELEQGIYSVADQGDEVSLTRQE